MNALLLLGVAANFLFAGLTTVSGEYPWLGPVLLALAGVSGLGVVLIAAGQKRAGAITVIVGSIAFVPLGLLAVVGARRVLDALNTTQFQARRATTQTSV